MTLKVEHADQPCPALRKVPYLARRHADGKIYVMGHSTAVCLEGNSNYQNYRDDDYMPLPVGYEIKLTQQSGE